MSRLEELIAELCPDGINYYDLEGVCKFQRGTSITAKNIIDGTVPVIAGGQKPAYYHNTANRTGETIAIAGSGAYAGYVSYWDIPVFLSDSFSVNPDKCLIPKYVYYFLQSKQNMIYQTKKGGGVPHVHGSSIAKIKIPVPPLQVQQEIVRILDNFTQLTTELTKRKGQYQYYINAIFQFNDECIEWKSLEELGSFIRGKRFTKDDYVEGDGISAIHYGEIYTNYGTSADNTVSKVKRHMAGKLRYASPSDVIFTDIGETVEDVGKAVAWLGGDKVAIHDHCYAFKYKINPKYISYYMQTDSFISQKIKYVVRTKVKTLLIDGFAKIKIPIPYPNNLEKSLEEQARIVTILDRFDTLCNDLTSGLPAEIEARKKQYEYYRDKLLTFKEAVQ